jgi:hypothetical protein
MRTEINLSDIVLDYAIRFVSQIIREDKINQKKRIKKNPKKLIPSKKHYCVRSHLSSKNVYSFMAWSVGYNPDF